MASLAILALVSALLVGAFAAATTSTRATRSVRAATVATALARRTLARALLQWSAADDALAIGAFAERPALETAAVSADAAETRLRIDRLSSTLYVVAVDVAVPTSSAPLARRRMRLLIERPASLDSTIIPTPRPITTWALGELY